MACHLPNLEQNLWKMICLGFPWTTSHMVNPVALPWGLGRILAYRGPPSYHLPCNKALSDRPHRPIPPSLLRRYSQQNRTMTLSPHSQAPDLHRSLQRLHRQCSSRSRPPLMQRRPWTPSPRLSLLVRGQALRLTNEAAPTPVVLLH